MSEEKPTFKITDRRLFNSDGSPRDIEREEEPATTTTDSAAATNASAATGDSERVAAAASAPPGEASAPSSGASSDASSASPNVTGAASSTNAPRDDTASTRAPSGADAQAAGGDPTAFVNLLMFIASPAAAAMGMTEHPGMSAGEVDLPLAKHCIDLLATMRQKTAGNLTPQEEQIFEGLLGELRMQFVSLTTVRPGTPGMGGRGPRGFTGSDITGGR